MKNMTNAKQPAFVAQGSYGCVMRPAYKCPDSNAASSSSRPPSKLVPHTIAKLFSRKRHFNEELEIDKHVRHIDPTGEFTIVASDHCELSSNLYPEHEVKLCTFHKFRDPTVPQIVYPDGGINLWDEVRRQGSSQTFENIYVAMEPVFKGLQVISAHGMVHQDIKPSNIVYDTNTNTCKLIDFGILIHNSNVFTTSNQYFLNRTYMYFPPEYKLQGRILSNCMDFNRFNPSIASNAYDPSFQDKYTKKIINRVQQNAQDFDNRILKNNHDVFAFSPDVQNLYSSGILSYKSKTGRLKDTIDMIVDAKDRSSQGAHVGIPSRIDVYMLGMTLLQVLVYKLKLNRFDRSNADFYKFLLHLIADMTCMNPRNRLTPAQAYQRYKSCRNMIQQRAPSKKRAQAPGHTKPPPPSRPSKRTNRTTPGTKSKSPSVQIVRSVKGRTPSVQVVGVRSGKKSPFTVSS